MGRVGVVAVTAATSALVAASYAGFALFVIDKVTSEFGEAGTLPVMLAAWAPASAGLMLSLALLLHLEDG